MDLLTLSLGREMTPARKARCWPRHGGSFRASHFRHKGHVPKSGYDFRRINRILGYLLFHLYFILIWVDSSWFILSFIDPNPRPQEAFGVPLNAERMEQTLE